MVTLQYPSQQFDTVSLKSKQPTLVNDASNGRSVSRYAGGHLWHFGISHPPLFRSVMAPIDGFLSYVGKRKKFSIVLPDRAIPQGVATGAPAIDNASGYAKDTDTINLKNVTPSTTNWFKAGDFFKADGHAKVYMCVENCNSDVSGNVTLIFEPPLAEAVADSELLTVVNVPFQVMSVKTHSTMVGNPASLYKTDVTLMEAL